MIEDQEPTTEDLQKEEASETEIVIEDQEPMTEDLQKKELFQIDQVLEAQKNINKAKSPNKKNVGAFLIYSLDGRV